MMAWLGYKWNRSVEVAKVLAIWHAYLVKGGMACCSQALYQVVVQQVPEDVDCKPHASPHRPHQPRSTR